MTAIVIDEGSQSVLVANNTFEDVSCGGVQTGQVRLGTCANNFTDRKLACFSIQSGGSVAACGNAGIYFTFLSSCCR
jgi:hypothetical protein